MNEQNKQFFRQHLLFSAIKSPLDIGALCSSSPSLASSMVDISDFQPNENIIELGAGTGAITAKINARLPRGCNFISIEKNPKLAQVTRDRLKGQVEVVEADIRDIDCGELGSIDCLISSLPMTLWKHELQKEIIASIHSHMAENGRMIFFSYLTSNIFGGKNMLLENLLDYFSNIHEYKVVWNNTPPARIYVCTNEQSSI